MKRIGAVSIIAAALLSGATRANADAKPTAPALDKGAGVTTDTIRPLAPNHAQVTFRTVDAKGELRPAGHVSRLEWIWSKASPSDAIESPALRVWLDTDIPAKWTVRKITGDAATVAEPFQPGHPPAATADQRGVTRDDHWPTQTIVVDLRARQTSLRLELNDETGKPRELTYTASILTSRPFVLVHPLCRPLGVRLLVSKVEVRSLYVGLSCAEVGPRGLDAVFFRSTDAAWAKGAGLVDFDPEQKFTAFKFRFARPARETGERITLFRVGLNEKRGGGGSGEFVVFYQTANDPSRFFGLVGLSPTYTKLDETAHGIHLSQYMLNLRLTGGYRLIPELVELAVDLNGDVFAFTHSPSRVPQAHFFGFGTRAAFRVPIEVSSTWLWLHGGWAVWGMHVANEVYGIRPLSGPGITGELRHTAPGAHGWSVWIRRATIAEPMQFASGNNYEEAVGALYELGPGETKPLALTADFRHVHSALDNGNNSIDGYAFAVGLTKGL